MSRPRFLTLFVCLIVLGCSGGKPPADVVIRNGTIYTANPAQPKAEAVAATAGKIVFVGSAADAAGYIGPNTKVIDLQGNTAYPGFTDSHYHLCICESGRREGQVPEDSACWHACHFDPTSAIGTRSSKTDSL